MSFDYGKEAYFKIEELSKRLATLENRAIVPQYTTQDMSFKLYSKSGGSKTIKFVAVGAQKIKLNIAITSYSTFSTVKLNDTTLPMSSSKLNTEIAVDGGENYLKFTFSSTVNDWITVSLEISGFLEPYKVERFLHAIGSSYYCYFDAGTLYIYNYTNKNPNVVVYDLKYGSAYYASNVGIMITAIDESGAMRVMRYSGSGAFNVAVNVVGQYNKSLINVKNGNVYLYAIKGNYLWNGIVNFSGDVTLTKTSQRASDIYYRTINSIDYLLITDITNVVSICQLSPTDHVTVITKNTVGRITGAKLAYNSGTPCVWHSKGGAIMERIFNASTGRFSSDGYLISADEAILMDNGTIGARTGGEVTIITR